MGYKDTKGKKGLHQLDDYQKVGGGRITKGGNKLEVYHRCCQMQISVKRVGPVHTITQILHTQRLIPKTFTHKHINMCAIQIQSGHHAIYLRIQTNTCQACHHSVTHTICAKVSWHLSSGGSVLYCGGLWKVDKRGGAPSHPQSTASPPKARQLS